MYKHVSNILIIAATTFEVEALLRYLNNFKLNKLFDFQINNLNIDFVNCGIGLAATTYNLTKKLNTQKYDLVLQLGIAGLYPTANIELGKVVFVATDQIIDLGVMQPDLGFQNLATIGLEDNSSAIFKATVPLVFKNKIAELPFAQGTTANCIQGNPNFYFEVNTKQIVVESMEGAAAAYVCENENINFVQIRALSNWVEPRDKSRWEMKLALENLNDFAIKLFNDFTK